MTLRITHSTQRILYQGNFAADSANLDYLTAIVRSADQLEFLCVPCKFSNTLSKINLRDQKVDTLSEPDHLDYFSRNLQSHTLKSSLTVYAVLVEKKLQV